MLTAHQRIALRRAGLRIEDDTGSTFVAILDRLTPAHAFEWRHGEPDLLRRHDLEPIILPFVAFRAARRSLLEPTDEGEIVVRSEWYVYSCSTEPDEHDISYAPQLDPYGEKALAFLRALVEQLG